MPDKIDIARKKTNDFHQPEEHSSNDKGIIYYIHILVHHVVLPTLYWTQTKLTQVTPPREATPSSLPRPPHHPPRPIRSISSELADGWLLVGRGECSYQKEKN